MSKVPTAYELACERIISTRFEKKRDEKPVLEFVTDVDSVPIEEPIRIGEVPVVEANTIHYDEDFDGMLEVHLNGNMFDYGGYGKMNRNIAFGLSDKNVVVKTDPEEYLVHVNDATQKVLKNMSHARVAPTAPKIYGVTVPSLLSHPGHKILYTMMETSQKVHPDYVGKLNLVNEIWTPTHYGKEILKASGVHPPIYVIPLGVDVDRYRPGVKPFNFGMELKGFRFMSVFRWSPRKAPDVLLKAYLQEFSADDDVSLLLVSRSVQYPESDGGDKIISDFQNIKATIGKPDDQMPYVALYDQPVPEKQMPALYNAADAFVLISRGEGFGIPYIEAGACGVPVIGSYCSGQSDFLNPENSYIVKPDGYLQARITGALSGLAKLCRFYEDQMFPDFGGNAISMVGRRMREVYENYQEAKQKAAIFRKQIEEDYTWEQMVNKIHDRLRAINRMYR